MSRASVKHMQNDLGQMLERKMNNPAEPRDKNHQSVTPYIVRSHQQCDPTPDSKFITIN